MDEKHEGPSSPKTPRSDSSDDERIMKMAQDRRFDSLDGEWIIEMVDKMAKAEPYGEMRMWEPPSIFRVPESLRGDGPEHYQPKVVAIGPYHRSNSKLLIKDENKWASVDFFVHCYSLDLKKWLHDMRSREEVARSYYSEDVSMDSKSFLEMLLLDSCFIFYAFKLILYPFIGEGWPMEQIILDLLMLENQIPFFVLFQLYHWIVESNHFDPTTIDTSIDNALVKLRRRLMLGDRHFSIREKASHLLDLFRLSLDPAKDPNAPQLLAPDRDISEIPMYVPRAWELQDRSAVEFKMHTGHTVLDIRFCDGVMKIPRFTINDETNTFLRNLIAFEQCCPEVHPLVTSYAVFIDCLINVEEDVNLLERGRIMLRRIRTGRDKPHFFSGLSLKADVRKSEYLDDVFVEVNRYYNRKWNKWTRWFADLKLNYCGSPWLAISVVAAAVLLILSFIQALYSVISYHHR